MAKMRFFPAKSSSALLLGLWLLSSCTLPDRTNSPTDSDDNTALQGVYEIAKDKRGLILTHENALTLPPAKVAVIVKIVTESLEKAPVTALVCEDFELAEDSSKISFTESSFRVQNRPPNFHMSTLLLLDLSGSVIQHKLPELRSATKKFINTLFRDEARANLKLAIYWFDGGEQINSLMEFTPDTSRMLDAADAISVELSRDYSTNLNGAVIQGLDLLKKETQKLKPPFVSHGSLVVFTDGTDRAARRSTKEAQNAIATRGPALSAYTIGLGVEIDQKLLSAFGQDGFAYADSNKEMEVKFAEIATSILNSIKSRYLVEYCSPKRRGRHNLTITAYNSKRRDLYGFLTVSFPADDFEGGCSVGESCSK
ncbi:MAG: VWA domain-containing protein [candidate division KSB1 bacterium]